MIWLILIVIAGVVAFFVWQNRKRKAKPAPPVADNLIPGVCYEPASKYKTAGGIIVRSYITPSADALARIEAGIAHTLRNTADQNWTQFRSLSDFQVYLIPPATHNTETDPGSPAILVNGIQAAGTCIGVADDPRYPSIVLPYEETELPEHAAYLEESARNEAEHIEMWANNQGMFYYYVGPLDQHPIFPDA